MPRRNSIRPVARLRRKELLAIVSSLQQFLYLSQDGSGAPCWDPDKEWSGADFAAYAAELLHLHGLAPEQKTPSRGFESDEVAETASCLQSDLTPVERLHLLSEVYRAVLSGYESFEQDEIGADLAYLLGAISTGDSCQWPPNRPLVKFLLRRFPASHGLWRAIAITDET